MSTTARLERQEAALLDVVRLGLIGDQRSLRQRARNLLRGGSDPVLSSAGRAYIRDLLAAGADLESARAASTDLSRLGASQPLDIDTADADAPVLEGQAYERVENLIREHGLRHLLDEAGLAPTTRILLTGPPGGGKTMTARHIAARLGLPLLLAEPSQILTGVMGESAHNLAALTQRASAEPCVLFLDELDAYARRRDDALDIAEPKRLVNTLLLELDRWPQHSVVIAATNHPTILDEAVTRRFEVTIELGYPDIDARQAIMTRLLQRTGRDCPSDILAAVARATQGRSGSAIVNATVAAVRRSIIDSIPLPAAVGQQFLAARFIGRGNAASAVRRRAAADLATAGRSYAEIAEILGVSVSAAANMLASPH